MKTTGRFFKRGYTLAEVLIVVIIIAVMATLAIPRFAEQKYKAATAEAVGIDTLIHRALLQTFDQDGSYPNPALTTDTTIKQTLGIDYQAPKQGWSFQTTTTGDVIATNDKGTLTLFADGTWGGSNRYDPDTGDLWPHLGVGTSTGGGGNSSGGGGNATP